MRHKRFRALRQLKKKELILSYKLNGCTMCGTLNNLTFHHVNQKTDEISDMVSRRGCSISKLKTELNFCIVLCRICHDKLHEQERSR